MIGKYGVIIEFILAQAKVIFEKPTPRSGSKRRAIPRVSKQRRQRQILWNERGDLILE